MIYFKLYLTIRECCFPRGMFWGQVNIISSQVWFRAFLHKDFVA